MPQAAFVIADGSSYPLREFITAVQHELELQGVPCRTYSSFPPPHQGQVYVLVSPREFVAFRGQSALPEQSVLDRTICLTAERPEQLSGPEDIAVAARAGAVFDISQRTVARFHQLGVAARLLRPGYSQPLDHFSKDAPRPIDVMFLGTDSPHRRAQLSAMAPVLSRRGCVLRISGDPVPPGETSSFLAASRWPLLARTKVLVNLHRGAPGPMAWLRMVDALHSGAVLLSEPATQTLPFVAGEHFVVARPAAMAHVLDGLLDDEVRLAAVREAAFERLSQWLPLAAPVSVLRAALVELVGQPLPARPRLGVAGPGPTPENLSEVGALRDELGQTRRQLEAMRDSMSLLREAVSVPSYARRPRLLDRTAAWSARGGPRVSILAALAGPADEVVGALDSLTCGRMTDRELVLAGDLGSVAVAEARRWIRTHPRIPAALLSVPAASGSDGRLRAALDVARGASCLLIGPGQRLFARGCEVLTAGLEGDEDLDFVYPIQAVRHPAGGDGSSRPGTLDDFAHPPGRSGRTVGARAPLLVRTQVLRAVCGSLSEDIHSGRTHPELLRQLTDSGFNGRLVPEILAWRPGVTPELRAA
jgi:hypothetical protein